MGAIATTLKNARERISKPEHWTKGTFARDKNGNHVLETQKEAVCFCSLGAINLSHRNSNIRAQAIRLLESNIEFLGQPNHWGIPSWNDKSKRTHDEVLEAFDLAIHQAEVMGL